MQDESINPKLDNRQPGDRRIENYLYQGATLMAALLLVLSAAV